MKVILHGGATAVVVLSAVFVVSLALGFIVGSML